MKYVILALLLMVACTNGSLQNAQQSATPLEQLNNAALEMKGWDVVTANFNDLTKIRTVHKDDALSVYGMGDEDWYYSKSADVTIIKCNEYNAVNGWIKGNAAELTAEQITESVIPWKENAMHVMESMNDNDMGMEHMEDMPDEMESMNDNDMGMEHMSDMSDER